MQLTLVIRKVNRITSNCLKTVESFKHKDVELKDVIFIDNISDIDYGMINSEWWVVFHDDEYVEERLLLAMMIGSKCEHFDVFSFYKADLDGKITYCPRMFRQQIRLEKDHLYPVLPARIESLLDGWVLEHANDENRSQASQDNVLFAGQDEEGVHRRIEEHDPELCQRTQDASYPQYHDREV